MQRGRRVKQTARWAVCSQRREQSMIVTRAEGCHGFAVTEGLSQHPPSLPRHTDSKAVGADRCVRPPCLLLSAKLRLSLAPPCQRGLPRSGWGDSEFPLISAPAAAAPPPAPDASSRAAEHPCCHRRPRQKKRPAQHPVLRPRRRNRPQPLRPSLPDTAPCWL